MLKRSKHNLSHHRLLTLDMGRLYPIGCVEALPGDTIRHSTSALVRMSPQLAPVMHPVEVRIHHFFVPFRLVWDNWEDFITGGPDGNNSSTFPTITLNTTTGGKSELSDYLGIPEVQSGTLEVGALQHRAFHLIYNEFYRDQDIASETDVATTDGADSSTDTHCPKISWEKDYFTSARPWTQKGADVTVPIGSTAPVTTDGTVPNFTGGGLTNQNLNVLNTEGTRLLMGSGSTSDGTVVFGNNAGLQADLASATGVDVNDLRLAFALQRMKEARARFGSRYTEYLQYLGVAAQDSRLQRPEYLGGGKQVIQFSEVLDQGSGASNVGNLKGHAIAAMRTNRYQRFIPEHGVILSLMSVRPKTMYMQSLPKQFNRRTKEEYFQPELQGVGQQVVKNKEVYAFHSSPDGTFGYQDRYDEYRRNESQVSGDFRDTLNFWHMARDFSSDPALNNTFVECNATNRTFASTSTQGLQVMANHSMVARRIVRKTAKNVIM
jgi:hypothetical protein